MAKWKNRYARKMAKRDFNRWWRTTKKKKPLTHTPDENDGCFTFFFWLLIGVPFMIVLLSFFKLT